MSSSDRRLFLLGLGALGLTGACGYDPVYGTGGTAEGLRGQVRADDPGSELDFALVERLEERLGRPGGARFRLSYGTATYREQPITYGATRYNVIGTVSFQLRDETSGAVVQSGTLRRFTSYSTTVSTVSTLSAQRDAERRVMVILADEIVTRLLATANDWLT